MKQLLAVFLLFFTMTAFAVTVEKSTSKVSGFGLDAQIISWTGLNASEDGEEARVAGYDGKSVQVRGTFGTSDTITIQGSNNGTSWTTLTDPQGNALLFTAAALEKIQEPTLYIRPITSSTVSSSLTVELFIQK